MPWLVLQPSSRRPRAKIHELVLGGGEMVRLTVGEPVWCDVPVAEVNALLQRTGMHVTEQAAFPEIGSAEPDDAGAVDAGTVDDVGAGGESGLQASGPRDGAAQEAEAPFGRRLQKRGEK